MLLIHGKMFGFIRCYGRRVNEDETGLLLNINLDDNALTPDLPLEVLEYFRLNKEKVLTPNPSLELNCLIYKLYVMTVTGEIPFWLVNNV